MNKPITILMLIVLAGAIVSSLIIKTISELFEDFEIEI